MRLLILALLISLTGCGTVQTENVYIVPDVPEETRKPCPVSDRKVSTVKDLAALATEHLGAAQCANSKIKAIDEILTKAEQKVGPQ